MSIIDLCNRPDIQILTPRQRQFNSNFKGKFFTNTQKFGYVGGTEEEAKAFAMVSN